MIDIVNIKINQEMLNIISEIDQFKVYWETLKNTNLSKLNNLHKIATIESIGSSNRIEGNKLSDIEVEKILNNINLNSFQNRDEQEVLGYAKLMNCIYNEYEYISFSENYIKQLHKILLSFFQKDEFHKGEYKKISNSVSAFDPNGKEIGIIFKTDSPFETPIKMKQLFQFMNERMKDKTIHPIILIGVFIVHFLAIHPFQDGNGRLSRAITTLLLLKFGYSYVVYSSIETVIEENKSAYYISLRTTQKTFSETPDYTSWLTFFLQSLKRQKIRLENKINKQNVSNNFNLPLLASKILYQFNEKNIWTTAELSEVLKIKNITIKKNLAYLVKNGLIKKNGSTRGAWYEKV